MSFHQLHFTKNLNGYVDVNIYLPVGTEYEDMIEPGEKFQTLWLLHGYAGNFMEWPQYSAIEKLAMLNKFAVVSVDGDNSGYNDMPNGDNYYTYITEELPTFLRKHYPLSDKREDNFIAGLSMGGFGAAKLGFNNPDKYGAIGIFSVGPFDSAGQYENMTEEQKKLYAACWKEYTDLQAVFELASEWAKAHYDENVEPNYKDRQLRYEYYNGLLQIEERLRKSGDALNKAFGSPVKLKWNDQIEHRWYEEGSVINEVYVDFA